MLKDKCKSLNADASVMCTPLVLLYEGLKDGRGNEFGCLKPIPGVYSRAVVFDGAAQRERESGGQEKGMFSNVIFPGDCAASHVLNHKGLETTSHRGYSGGLYSLHIDSNIAYLKVGRSL